MFMWIFLFTRRGQWGKHRLSFVYSVDVFPKLLGISAFFFVDNVEKLVNNLIFKGTIVEKTVDNKQSPRL